MEENNNIIIPSVLLFTAVVELGMTPLIMAKVKGPQKMIVGASMFLGALITGAIGIAFWMGWLP